MMIMRLVKIGFVRYNMKPVTLDNQLEICIAS